jgi:hypothetical protein
MEEARRSHNPETLISAGTANGGTSTPCPRIFLYQFEGSILTMLCVREHPHNPHEHCLKAEIRMTEQRRNIGTVAERSAPLRPPLIGEAGFVLTCGTVS